MGLQKKYVIFGGFDYAVRWEMDQDAIFRGIDYFVDNDPELIGTTYLGKPICAPEKLLEEPRGGIFILIGSIVYRTELEFQLLDMGFEKDRDFAWGIAWSGNEECPKLWKHIEWNDEKKNKLNMQAIESSDEMRQRNYVASRLIDFQRYKNIIELGAANERIREFLPEDILYTPVDYIKYSEDTVVVDLNKNPIPDFKTDVRFTVFLLLSCLPYFAPWKERLRQAAEQCDCMLISHNDFVRMNREYRRTHFTNNTAFFNHEVILEMQKIGFGLTDAIDFRLRTVIMKFERN